MLLVHVIVEIQLEIVLASASGNSGTLNNHRRGVRICFCGQRLFTFRSRERGIERRRCIWLRCA